MKRSLDRTHVLVAVLAVVFGMGPTVGDIGSCGQPAEDLDPVLFFRGKRNVDCQRCRECGLTTKACKAACGTAPATAFPEGCRPLVHDGEVCLDVLNVASCADYATFMDDAAPTAPSECQFCPL